MSKELSIFVLMRKLLLLSVILYTQTAISSNIQVELKGIIAQFSNSFRVHELDELTGYNFIQIKALNVEQTIFVFQYKEQQTPEYQAINLIRQLPYYVLHQEDTEIKLRSTLPNDTLFNKQWHLPIIKATQAWDLNRKGVNKAGDTIVIAVIDDGLHINHPDFQGNIWINYADTIGNGIDDDSNGYIDDHYGWNFVGNDNDISDSNYYKAGHGTPVAGIIGARGNNITGVTGIMWNVKLMIVNFTDTGRFPNTFQSDVIKAYNYVLHQRKLYNSTNGQKGAFVVATNASWGVDGKFPNQAPIWCSLYDTLGKYGITNVSAATNNNGSLVDTDGDLPTLCPSNHLITVNSTSSSDKHFNSGFSPISIDLSAPGSSIFSTGAYTKANIDLDRIYRSGFSGTSFATPMVTAAVGVLHSYACERVLDSIKTNPAKGSLMMRKFILEGVDPIDDLNGKNVTGGRLNIKKSMEIMDQYCYGYVGTNSILSSHNLSLYPNPGNGSIQLVSDVSIQKIECFDFSGKHIDCNVKGSNISIEHLSSGMYFFKIYTQNSTHSLKYLKLH
ncbi:MAG: S8 family peptidase [Bacteroidia bacterium]